MRARLYEVQGEMVSLGATVPQIALIERTLPLLGWRLAPAEKKADIDDVLSKAGAATRVLVEIADKAAMNQHYGTALARLDTSEYRIEVADSDGGKIPDVVDFAALSRLLDRMVQAAMSETHTQARGMADPGAAVKLVLEAIWRPDDSQSRGFAAKAVPTSEVSLSNPFAKFVQLVFYAATGDEGWHQSIEGGGRSLKRCIDAFRARFPQLARSAEEMRAAARRQAP